MLSLKLLYKSPLAALLTGWKKKKKGVVVRALDDPDLEKDPLRAEYVKSIPEAQLYMGVLLQGYLIPTDLLEGLDDISIRKDDVFIITYPKSGTTWTEEIVSLIYKGGDVSKVEKELLFNRVHHLEVGRPIGHLRFLQKLRSPRLIATHLPLPLLPRQLKRYPKCKIIYVMRNPKDTAVSYYHHHKISNFLGNSTATWDQFLAYFMSGNVVYGSWFDHVLPYWEFCKHYPNNVFFISYEELKLDLKSMVYRLCEFLEQSLEDEAIDSIVEHCTFESMKTNNMVNREVVPIPDLFDMSKSKFMRKGIIGDWKNYFTKEQSEAFDQMCRSHMFDSDLPLVFEPEEAAELLINEGRIIFNHPQRCTDLNNENIIENDDEDDDEEIELHYPQYEPRYPDRSSWLPSVHLHVLPDPLTLDAVG